MVIPEGILSSFAKLAANGGITSQLVAEYLHFVEFGWMSGKDGG
jgi:hypothetical protein